MWNKRDFDEVDSQDNFLIGSVNIVHFWYSGEYYLDLHDFVVAIDCFCVWLFCVQIFISSLLYIFFTVLASDIMTDHQYPFVLFNCMSIYLGLLMKLLRENLTHI